MNARWGRGHGRIPTVVGILRSCLPVVLFAGCGSGVIGDDEEPSPGADDDDPPPNLAVTEQEAGNDAAAPRTDGGAIDAARAAMDGASVVVQTAVHIVQLDTPMVI